MTTTALAALAETDPVAAEELKTLHALITLAGSQKATADACDKAYKDTRKDIEALMRKHNLIDVPVQAGSVIATIKLVPVRVIDAKRFFEKVTRKVFWALCSIPVGKAEAEVGETLVCSVADETVRESLYIEAVKGATAV